VDGQPAPAVPVVVGTILDPPAIRLGEFLRAVRERGPQLHPELRHGISGSVLREVQGRVDLGFFLGETDGPGWRVQTLAPVRYVVVAPRGWQPAGRPALGGPGRPALDRHAQGIGAPRPAAAGLRRHPRAPWPGWTRRPRCWTWCGPASA
jgi:hypothetical protein